MSFWQSLAQLAVRSFDPAECTQCPKGRPGEDPAFATAVTALGAKLAMADGLAQAVERTAFLDVFQPEPEAKANVLKLYDLARQTSLGFESYALRLAKRYAKCPQILEDVLEGLFHIALSDGHLTDREETYLETVAELFGLSNLTYRRIRAGYVPLDVNDPFYILGLMPDATPEMIKKARLSLLSEFHPDRLRQRGLPEAYLELYTEKTARINQAYDQLMRLMSPQMKAQMNP